MKMLDTEMLRDQLMLGPNIVIHGNFRERFGRGMVRRRRGLAVPKECGNYDKVLEGVNSPWNLTGEASTLPV